jgi:16S rRNA (guanine527-N7)-methyltransferase
VADAEFDAALREALAEFGVSFDDEAVRRMTIHYELLVERNRTVNLTRITAPRDAARFHFAEAGFAARQIASKVRRVVDVGSGGGFPGLPLAALMRDRQVLLVESVGKKSAFLHEAALAMGASNVRVVNARFHPDMVGRHDAIVARAVDKFSALLPVLFEAPARQVLLYAGEELLGAADRLGRTPGRRIAIPGFDRRWLGVYEGST